MTATVLDETHDLRRQSWVSTANGHPEFPIQNLPFGVFSPNGGAPHGGIAIGDSILDIGALLAAGLFSGEAESAARAAAGATLNPWMALGRGQRTALRKRVSALLAADGSERAKVEKLASKILYQSVDCTLHLPAAIGDYTDFFAGIQHAYNGGVRAGRQPASPAQLQVRAGGVSQPGIVRGAVGHRAAPPQRAESAAGKDEPSFGPCLRLDMELELGLWVGPGNALGEPVPIARAGEHIVGLCMLNDWSARDIQRWESAPLGPFLAKNFGTTSRRGSSRWRRWRRFARRSRRGRPGIPGPWRICGTRRTRRKAPSTSGSRR